MLDAARRRRARPIRASSPRIVLGSGCAAAIGFPVVPGAAPGPRAHGRPPGRDRALVGTVEPGPRHRPAARRDRDRHRRLRVGVRHQHPQLLRRTRRGRRRSRCPCRTPPTSPRCWRRSAPERTTCGPTRGCVSSSRTWRSTRCWRPRSSRSCPRSRSRSSTTRTWNRRARHRPGAGPVLMALSLGQLFARFGGRRVLTTVLHCLPVALVAYAARPDPGGGAVAIFVVGFLYIGALSSFTTIGAAPRAARGAPRPGDERAHGAARLALPDRQHRAGRGRRPHRPALDDGGRGGAHGRGAR